MRSELTSPRGANQKGRKPVLSQGAERFFIKNRFFRTCLEMIISAENPSWPMDVVIDSSEAGLRAPSKVRMKPLHAGQSAGLTKGGCPL